MSCNSPQAIYKPLPQSVSDSDSEKEMQDVAGPKFSQSSENGSIHNKNKKKNKLMMDNSTVYHNGYSLPNHHVIQKDVKYFQGWSLCRIILFFLSIAFFFAMTCAFIWGMPCGHAVCPIKITNWNQVFDFELKGKINVVQGVRSLNLVLLYRSSINESENGGAICFLGNNGKLAWYIPQKKVPKSINCDLIDVNDDKILDCLLLGEVGIEAVEPVSGKIIWHVHTDYETKPIVNVEFPTVLPDLNGDGVKDLIMRLSLPGNKCLVVSGRTGIVLYELVLNDCEIVEGVTYYDKNFIYLCRNRTSQTYYRISTSDLSIRVYNRNLAIVPVRVDYRIQQSNTYSRGGYKLIVENKGKDFPDSLTNVSLIEEKSNKIVWNYFHANTFTMKPTSFTLQNAVNNLHGHTNGFIIKIWNFVSINKQGQQQQHQKRSVPLSSSYSSAINNNTIKLNRIVERIVLITFNESDIRVTNTSTTEIVQMCLLKGDKDNPTWVCQPDLENQKESLLVADLDMDGKQELMSTSSTAELNYLSSTLRVLKFQEELPKLYARSYSKK